MEKEQVIEKLEEVFVKACDWYINGTRESLTEIRELGESIIKAKQNVMYEVKQVERFIDQRVNSLTRNPELHDDELPTRFEGSE